MASSVRPDLITRRQWLLGLSAGLSVFGSGCTDFLQSPPDARSLARMAFTPGGAYEAVTGTRTIRIAGADGSEHITERFWEKPPAHERREIESSTIANPAGPGTGDVVVKNEHDHWEYDRAEAVVERRDSDLASIPSDLDDRLALYEFEYVGETVVGDRTTQVIDITPPNGGSGELLPVIFPIHYVESEDGLPGGGQAAWRLWMETNREFPVKEQVTYSVASGSTQESTVMHTDLEFDPRIAVDRFQFAPPPEVEVIESETVKTGQFDTISELQEEAPFVVPEPVLPAGFGVDIVQLYRSFDEQLTATIEYERETDWLRYSVHDTPTGTSETETVGGVTGELHESDGPEIKFSWDCPSIGFTIESTLGRATIADIVSSVRCLDHDDERNP